MLKGTPTMHTHTDPRTRPEVPNRIPLQLGKNQVVGIVEPTPVPGLAVAPRLRRDIVTGQWRFTGQWGLVHVASGCQVFSGVTGGAPGHVRDAAVILGEYGIDWTLPAAELRDQYGVRETVRAVACELERAVEDGRPVCPKVSSWRRCTPAWQVVLRDAEGNEVEAYADVTYADAEDVAVELGVAHGLHDPSQRRGAVVDITVQRGVDSEWELACAHRDCPEVLAYFDPVGPVRLANRALLEEMATADEWRRIDERRWLCPDCHPLYQQG
ncbi:hypothetical protein E1181_25600 [Saccharopolyspora terrae]|uniref:Uncharacterized protein n=1 Tax=Saccharopolyspora terrae TaxID=2530384 RepID=A0A4R4VF85_9PSEU|nr:hypothetical protein [Saccharopolyspora terrae]TDD01283.1 hypothetical protein E1181_25600 [Saccharopolyspora terrae]